MYIEYKSVPVRVQQIEVTRAGSGVVHQDMAKSYLGYQFFVRN